MDRDRLVVAIYAVSGIFLLQAVFAHVVRNPQVLDRVKVNELRLVVEELVIDDGLGISLHFYFVYFDGLKALYLLEFDFFFCILDLALVIIGFGRRTDIQLDDLALAHGVFEFILLLFFICLDLQFLVITEDLFNVLWLFHFVGFENGLFERFVLLFDTGLGLDSSWSKLLDVLLLMELRRLSDLQLLWTELFLKFLVFPEPAFYWFELFGFSFADLETLGAHS